MAGGNAGKGQGEGGRGGGKAVQGEGLVGKAGNVGVGGRRKGVGMWENQAGGGVGPLHNGTSLGTK